MTSPAKEMCDAYGIDRVCTELISGLSLTEIASLVRVSIGTFLSWLDGDIERSARAREARTSTARLWDERASKGIEDAADQFELSKAKELAHHYRWRASKIAPKEYGDKLQQEITGKDGAPLLTAIEVTFVKAGG